MSNERFVQFCKLPISVVTKFAEEIGVHGAQSQSENDFDYKSRVWRIALQNGKSYAAVGLVMEHAEPISETHPWIIDRLPATTTARFSPLANELLCHLDAIFADATPSTAKHVDLAAWVVRNKKELLTALGAVA